MEIKGKKTLVFGSGISGIGAARLLEKKGAEVILYDSDVSLDVNAIKEEISKQGCTNIITGVFPETLLSELDLVVLSPGVPTDLSEIQKMKEKKIPVIGEVELAFIYGKGDVLAITGTNGKTTTTALLGEIVEEATGDVFVVGNIGNSYTQAIEHMTEKSVTVAEMSSFQLESIDTFRPKVSAILNITPDHLNRHHTMEAYVEAKYAIAKNQQKQDICVLNYEDENLRKFGKEIKAQVLYFSSQRKLEKGIYLDHKDIIYKDKEEHRLCRVEELRVLGVHNYENVMAAAAMSAAYGIPMDVVVTCIKRFAGVAHRIEFVAEKNHITFYNDSKGTNPDAAIRGIQAMNRPTVLIGGGYDKDSSYKEWIESFEGKVKQLILTGETKENIAKEARACGFEAITLTDTFEEAVMSSIKAAEPGDAVLLSPACASWGMFSNYEERGDKFKEIVNSL